MNQWLILVFSLIISFPALALPVLDRTQRAQFIEQLRFLDGVGENYRRTIEKVLEPTKQGSVEVIRRQMTSLSRYAGYESVQLVLHRLEQEILRADGKPNTQVIRELLNYLGRTAINDYAVPLRQLLDTTEALLVNSASPEKAKKTRDAFIATLNNVQRRNVPLNSMFGIEDPLVNLNGDQLPALEQGAGEAGHLVARPARRAPPGNVNAAAAQVRIEVPDFFSVLEKKLKELGLATIPPEISDLLNSTSNNFYDKAANLYNDPQGGFIDYFGRKDEVRKISEALMRLEKGHVLMTGKAGVGKTTIIKMLMQAYLMNEELYPGDKVPFIFELPITTVSSDRSIPELMAAIRGAKVLADFADRHVVIFIDEAHVATSLVRNSLKAFLTELLNNENNRVHLIWATTSDESRDFFNDKAFKRRWVDVYVPEFSHEESILAIKQAFIPQWQVKHNVGENRFSGVEEDAFLYSAKNGSFEQLHAANPTAMKEMLEGAIVHKLSQRIKEQQRGSFSIGVTDLQEYLRFQKNFKLLPGDPNFMEVFDDLWQEFDNDFAGNEGFKSEIRRRLITYFSSMNRQQMESMVFMGPPGGGKTYAAEKISEHFFDGAILRINAADFQEEHQISRLTGSSPGFVGFKEGVSMLATFFADNPNGGVIKIEEADYLHPDILRLFVNMITDKEWIDAKGVLWRTDQYILILNTNVGQEYLVPTNSKQLMTWEQYESRRNAITEEALVDGEPKEVIKSHYVNLAFERFLEKMIRSANPLEDTAAVAQELIKQKRRYTPYYILAPNREDLELAGKNRIDKFIQTALEDYKVTIRLAEDSVSRILDLDHYEFEKGFSYVIAQVENKLVGPLSVYLSQEGQELDVFIRDSFVEVGGATLPSEELVVQYEGREDIYNLKQFIQRGDNQWAQNENMVRRIRNFHQMMREHLKGDAHIIARTKSILELKLVDWDTRPVFTLLGSSGNGKTEFAKALAQVLFGSPKAMFSLSGLNSVTQLNDFLRPPRGYVGSYEQSEFEIWFDNQKHSGGGVILLDELLSFYGLSPSEVAERIGVINKLYDLLDEGQIRFGNRIEDASGFIIVITGNSLQELFDRIEDTPDAKDLVQKILSHLTEQDVIDYFKSVGLDAPKIARLGEIFVKGPLPEEVANEVGLQLLEKNVQKKLQEALAARRVGGVAPELIIPDELVQNVVVRVKTVRLGMRKVNRALKKIFAEPISSILIAYPDTDSIEVRQGEDGRITWYADDTPLALVEQKTSGDDYDLIWKKLSDDEGEITDRTPQLVDLETPEKITLSKRQIANTARHEVYGHWMTGVLLTGKNRAEVISIIPKGSSVGHVRYKVGDTYTAATLSSLLKKIARLEAGHRALFNRGVYATGGGSLRNPKSSSKYGSDDLSKVEQALDTILANQLLNNANQYSPEERQDQVKQEIREIMKKVADIVIEVGVSSGDFDEIFEKARTERFLDSETLDSYVKALKDKKRLPDPDRLFLLALNKSIGDEPSNLGLHIIERVLEEIEDKRDFHGTLNTDLMSSIEKIRNQHNFLAREVQPEAVSGCELIMAELYPGKAKKAAD